jgi:two-component system, response regulator PdtaR
MSTKLLRVLLVEDQFLIAKQLEAIVSGAGHKVVGIATNREEACALAMSENPDIAFVDVSLADGPTGTEIAQFISDNCDARVLFTTANRRRLPDNFCGAIGIVDKPFTANGILLALNYIISTWSGGKVPELKMPTSLSLSPAYAASLQIA